MGILSATGGSGVAEIKAVASGPVIAIGLTASIGGFLFGADTGQISGFLVMPDFLSRFAQHHSDGTAHFDNVRAGTIVGLLSIGALVGSLAAGPVSNRWGRRIGILLGCVVFCVGTTIQISAMKTWTQVAIGRLVCGIAVGMMSVLVPVYVSETMPKEVRGAMVATYQLFVTLGILISYIINLGCSYIKNSGSWRVPMGVTYAYVLFLAAGMFMLPESPRWLLSRGRTEQTMAAIRFIAGKKLRDNAEYIDGQYQEFEQMVEMDKDTKKVSWFSSFNPRHKVLYRTLLGFSLQMFQQLTGANYFFYYGASIFQSVGISNSYVTQIILGAVNVLCTFPGLWFIERFGRRRVLIFGGLWQCCWLLIFGTIGGELNPREADVGVGLIICACLFISGFASTWGPAVWVSVGEMFPLHVRAHSASFATAGNWSWNFLLTFFTPTITASIGYRYGYVFAGCNLLAVMIVYLCLCESSNLTLEHVDAMYNDPNVKPWNSAKWVPPGHASRHEAAIASKTDSHHDDSESSSKELDGAHMEKLGDGRSGSESTSL